MFPRSIEENWRGLAVFGEKVDGGITLDVEVPRDIVGHRVIFHHVNFLGQQGQRELGEDGHQHLAVLTPGGVESDQSVILRADHLLLPGPRHHLLHAVLHLLLWDRLGPEERFQLAVNKLFNPRFEGLQTELLPHDELHPLLVPAGHQRQVGVMQAVLLDEAKVLQLVFVVRHPGEGEAHLVLVELGLGHQPVPPVVGGGGAEVEVVVVVNMDAGGPELLLIVLEPQTHQAVVVLHDPAGDVDPVCGALIHQHGVLVGRPQEVRPEENQPVLVVPEVSHEKIVVHGAKQDAGAESVHRESVGFSQLSGEHSEEADHLGVVVVSEHLKLLFADQFPRAGVDFLPDKIEEGHLCRLASVVLSELPLSEEFHCGQLLHVVLVANLPALRATVDAGEHHGCGSIFRRHLRGSFSKLWSRLGFIFLF